MTFRSIIFTHFVMLVSLTVYCYDDVCTNEQKIAR